MSRPRRSPRPLLVLALLVAAGLRGVPLLDNRFHPDEALYASFARRIATGHDPMLAGVLVDKPPLPFYLSGLSAALLGPSELALRLPNYFASLVAVALLYQLARRLYGGRVAVRAAWLLAVSPFDILFAITAFIDPLLTVAWLAALWAAAAGRVRVLACALAFAFAIKQTALLLAPLALVLGLLHLHAHATPRQAARRLAAAAWPTLAALALTACLIFAWDALRQPEIGFWAQGYSDNVPGRFVRAAEVLPRARAWLGLLHYGTGAAGLNLVWLVGLPVLLASDLPARSRAGLADRMFMLYGVMYLGAYWLLAFNVWDRYLLPLLPLGLMLLARVLYLLTRALESAIRGLGRHANLAPGRTAGLGRAGAVALSLALIGTLIPPAASAARSRYPIGGDHGAYDGVDAVAAHIKSLPEGSVLYDHWLSWQWNYYLYDGPVYVSWFATPEALAADLRVFGTASPRYLVVPAWESEVEVRAAAAAAGFGFAPLFTAYRRDGMPSMTLYALRPS